jgi:Effector Associated Constant Component 1
VAVPSVDLSVSDHTQLSSLESVLRREMPELVISRVSGSPAAGELGWEDVLLLTFAGVSALADAIELVKAYLDSRDDETGVTISATNSTRRRIKSIEVRHATDAQVKEFLDWFKHE